jgi:tetratricopeptide (TPR) repeat protein
MREQAFALYQAGDYAKAAGIYRSEYEAARDRGARRAAARSLNNLAGSQFALLRYREALETYLEARKAAEEAGDAALAATLSANLSSLYLQLNEPGLAREALKRAMAGARELTPRTQAALLLQQMAIEALEGDLPSVRRTFNEALWLADRAGQAGLQAQAWSNLGWTFLRAGHLDGADQALTESFRVRRLHEPSATASSYVRLSALRLAQGNAVEALLFANLALSGSPAASEPSWVLFYQRGLAYRALGQPHKALDDLRRSVDLIRRWRADVAGAERLRAGAEVRLNEIYADYIALTSELYAQTAERRELGAACPKRITKRLPNCGQPRSVCVHGQTRSCVRLPNA